MNYEEIELALAVCSETPSQVVAEIADLRTVGSYRLRPRPDMAIHDVYFDLADGALHTHKLGMRVRSVDGCQFITLKGRAEDVAGGGKSREEIELEWSVEALGVVVARLADFGIVLARLDLADARIDPLAVLTQIGFVVLQTRDTVRRPRDVFTTKDSTMALAELVVDSVVFQFPFGRVRHHEVEIEVKGAGGVEAMQDVSVALLSQWPAVLRVWKHGKRSTGTAAAALISERGRGGILNDSGDLTPGTYDLIDSYLGQVLQR